jgi:hypothetical protein
MASYSVEVPGFATSGKACMASKPRAIDYYIQKNTEYALHIPLRLGLVIDRYVAHEPSSMLRNILQSIL